MAVTMEQPVWGTHFTSAKILFYSLFWGVHIALFAAGWHIQASDARLSALNILQYSVWISRGSALVLSFDATLIMLPMCRNILKLIRPKIRWMPLDESIWFHRQVAYAMLLFTVIHVAAHYVK